MISKLMNLAIVVVISSMTTGCVSTEIMSAKATAYNVAVADLSNQLLLLNALRASQRMPTYYTRLEGDTSALTATPTYTGSGPIGPDVAKKGVSYLFTLTGTSQNQLTLGTLDDQKFMRGVLTPVPLDVLGFFLGQGWPPELLFSMTISKISTTKGQVAELIQSFEANCSENPTGDYCNGNIPDSIQETAVTTASNPEQQQYVSRRLAACVVTNDNVADEPSGPPAVGPATPAAPDTSTPITFENYPPVPGQISCFQWALRVIIALDPELKSTTSEDVVAENVPNGDNPGLAISDLLKSDYVIATGTAPNAYTICKKNKVTGLTLEGFTPAASAQTTETPAHTTDDKIQTFAASGPAVTAKCGQTGPSMAAADPTSSHGALKLQLTTRSLDGMVYFLGEVLRSAGVVSAGPGDFTKIWVWNTSQKRYDEWDLFDVRQGTGPIAVGFMDSIYAIPPACPAAGDCPDRAQRHTSFQAIALLNQVWGLQKEETELPVSPVVTVINP